jgi:hypothetical protein
VSTAKPRNRRFRSAAVGLAVLVALVVIAVAVWGYRGRTSSDEDRENPAMAAAEMLVWLDPDQEMLAKDPVAETLTVRDKNTGQVATIDVNQIRDGKISLDYGGDDDSTPDDDIAGNQEASPSPDAAVEDALLHWVPRFPGAQFQQEQQSNIPQGLITIFSVRSNAAAEEVLAFYSRHFEDQGFEVSRVDVPGAESTVFAVGPDKLSKLNISLADRAAGGCAGTLRVNESQP